MCTTRTAWETFKRFFKVLEPTVQHFIGNIDKTDQNEYVTLYIRDEKNSADPRFPAFFTVKIKPVSERGVSNFKET